MIFIFELIQFINNGEVENQYLYLRRKLNWGIIDYTTYTIVVGMFGMVSNFIITPLLSEKFQLRDSLIAIIDITGHLIQTIILSITSATWMAYLSIFSTISTSGTGQLIRCMISKNVNPSEVGKIFSILGAFQAFIPFITSPFFGTLYRSTVETLPQAYLIVLACLYFICWFVMIYIDRGLLKFNLDEAIEPDDDKSNNEEGKDVIHHLLVCDEEEGKQDNK